MSLRQRAPEAAESTMPAESRDSLWGQQQLLHVASHPNLVSSYIIKQHPSGCPAAVDLDLLHSCSRASTFATSQHAGLARHETALRATQHTSQPLDPCIGASLPTNPPRTVHARPAPTRQASTRRLRPTKEPGCRLQGILLRGGLVAGCALPQLSL